MTLGWEHPQNIPGFSDFPKDQSLVLYQNIWWYRIQTVMILTVGTLLLMWLGEQITERGIGNGVSLVITIGILARLPQAIQGLVDMFKGDNGFAVWQHGGADCAVDRGGGRGHRRDAGAAGRYRCNTRNGRWAGRFFQAVHRFCPCG